MAEWKPAVIDEYIESLLKRGLFRQAMNERLAKARGGEDREALARVDSYMTGFLAHEWRKASRKKVGGRGKECASGRGGVTSVGGRGVLRFERGRLGTGRLERLGSWWT